MPVDTVLARVYEVCGAGLGRAVCQVSGVTSPQWRLATILTALANRQNKASLGPVLAPTWQHG